MEAVLAEKHFAGKWDDERRTFVKAFGKVGALRVVKPKMRAVDEKPGFSRQISAQGLRI